MILDTSILLAIYFNEPMGLWALDQLERAGEPLQMSTVNLTETLILLRDRNKSGFAKLRERLFQEPIKYVPPSTSQAQIAAEARLKFPINLGDCFAYALAHESKEALITLDEDFIKTDITVLIPTTK
mgnify:CR=1 FL=1